MPSIRSLKPEFWEDEPLARLGSDARLLFQALWNLADDYGRLRDDVGRIHRFAFAAEGPRPHIDRHQVHTELERIRSIGKIVRYSVNGRRYIVVAAFEDNQKPRRRFPSRMPEPPAEDLEKAQGLRRQAEDDLNYPEKAATLPLSGLSMETSGKIAEKRKPAEMPPDASAGLGPHLPDHGNKCPPVSVAVCGAVSVAVPGEEPSGARARGNETSSPDDTFDFEDDPDTGLPGAVQQEVHMRLSGALNRCFGASDRWDAAAKRRWRLDLGALAHAGTMAIDEIESYLVREDTKPDIADIRDPIGWIRRVLARRSAQHRAGGQRRKQPPRDPKHGSTLQV